MADDSPPAGPYYAVVVHNRTTSQPIILPVHVAARDAVAQHLGDRLARDLDGSFARYWVGRGRMLLDLSLLLNDETALQDALLHDASVRALYELGRRAGQAER